VAAWAASHQAQEAGVHAAAAAAAAGRGRRGSASGSDASGAACAVCGAALAAHPADLRAAHVGAALKLGYGCSGGDRGDGASDGVACPASPAPSLSAGCRASSGGAGGSAASEPGGCDCRRCLMRRFRLDDSSDEE